MGLLRRLLLVLGTAAMTAGVGLLLIEGDEGYFLMAVVGFAAVAFVAAGGGPRISWVPPEPEVASGSWSSDPEASPDERLLVPDASDRPVTEFRVGTEHTNPPKPADRSGSEVVIEPSPTIESPRTIESPPAIESALDRLVTAQNSDSPAAFAAPSTGPLTPSERAERFVQRPGGAAATLAGALAVVFGLRRVIRG